MKVEQIYSLANQITGEALGETQVLKEDLSNVVEWGDTIQNVLGLDNYVKSLVDQIGRMVFVNRAYSPTMPSILMDGWEYGSILEKVATNLPDAQENESWMLEDGQSYDPFVFKSPDVISKFYNNLKTFEIQMSFAERQVKSAFQSPTQLNSFFSMIEQSIQNSLAVKTDEMSMRTINNMIGETFYNLDSGGSYTGKTGVRCVNLLYLYNTYKFGSSTGSYIDVDTFIHDPDAIRFSINIFKNYIDRLKRMSTLFNVGGQPRFTPNDRLHVIMLSEYKNAADVFLQSGTFNDQYTALPNSETQVYWQGSGTGYSFSDTSKINITTATGHDVEASGIIAVMFDRDALGVCNKNNRVTSAYNAKAEFYNNFYKFDCNYFNDGNENFIVFYAA